MTISIKSLRAVLGAEVDGIDLSRHQQAKTKATLVTVIAEAWARTGQGKKALDTLGVFDPEDPEFTELKGQLYRAFAFAYAAVNDGWKVAIGTLMHERSTLGASLTVIYKRMFNRLVELAHATRRNGHSMAEDPIFRR
jgi:hypothetical protein